MKYNRLSKFAIAAAIGASTIAMPFAAFANEQDKNDKVSNPGVVHVELRGANSQKSSKTEDESKKDDKLVSGDLRNGKMTETKAMSWIASLQAWLAQFRAQGTTTPPFNHSKPPHATSTPPIGSNASTTPVVSNITASFGSGSIRIAWNSSSLSDSAVFYSTSTPVVIGATSTLVAMDSNLVTKHSLNLTGLATSTQYYFIIQSKNQVGTTTTGQFSLTTLNQ